MKSGKDLQGLCSKIQKIENCSVFLSNPISLECAHVTVRVSIAGCGIERLTIQNVSDLLCRTDERLVYSAWSDVQRNVYVPVQRQEVYVEALASRNVS